MVDKLEGHHMVSHGACGSMRLADATDEALCDPQVVPAAWRNGCSPILLASKKQTYPCNQRVDILFFISSRTNQGILFFFFWNRINSSTDHCNSFCFSCSTVRVQLHSGCFKFGRHCDCNSDLTQPSLTKPVFPSIFGLLTLENLSDQSDTLKATYKILGNVAMFHDVSLLLRTEC